MLCADETTHQTECVFFAERTLNVESDAIAKMTEMRDRGALAFVGSGYSCKSEALVADAWNLPMIAFVSVAVGLIPEERTYCTVLRRRGERNKGYNSIRREKSAGGVVFVSARIWTSTGGG